MTVLSACMMCTTCMLVACRARKVLSPRTRTTDGCECCRSWIFWEQEALSNMSHLFSQNQSIFQSWLSDINTEHPSEKRLRSEKSFSKSWATTEPSHAHWGYLRTSHLLSPYAESTKMTFYKWKILQTFEKRAQGFHLPSDYLSQRDFLSGQAFWVVSWNPYT